MSVVQVILAILALGLLIIVHEGGHYFVARWCRMRVERFSLGFGPAILKWQKRGETALVDGKIVEKRGTIFQVAPIPLGGFVQITGMNPHEEFNADDPNVYPNRPTWQRFLTIFAGPFTNLLFSIVLVFIVFSTAGMNSLTGFLLVDDVSKPSGGEAVPAAGVLERGDKLLLVDGVPIFHTDNANVLGDRLQITKDKTVQMTVERNGKVVTVPITPRYDEKAKSYRIGVVLGREVVRKEVPFGTAAVESVKYPWVKSGQLLANLYEVVRGRAPADATGPVGITKMIHTSFGLGWASALEFLAFLNVALGLFNLLPIPALDGGRLVFLSYELVTRRRPNPRVEAAVHMVGFVVLMLLFVVITFKDIKGLFT